MQKLNILILNLIQNTKFLNPWKATLEICLKSEYTFCENTLKLTSRGCPMTTIHYIIGDHLLLRQLVQPFSKVFHYKLLSRLWCSDGDILSCLQLNLNLIWLTKNSGRTWGFQTIHKKLKNLELVRHSWHLSKCLKSCFERCQLLVDRCQNLTGSWNVGRCLQTSKNSKLWHLSTHCWHLSKM